MILSMHNVPVSSPAVRTKPIPKYFNVPFAIQHGYFRCVRYLLELSSDPNERDNQLRTPLILCSYVENDRWSLSLAQNLLEKGAKVALEDHARRNALHHACAMQRFNLVELFLSCLEFDLEAKDCEGNTCLHYVAITGNCEIAEILMRKAEKLQIPLDQSLNREGCSAAVLALKYGHIECANQITHRDSDEFFVIPRPLSIYESSKLPEEKPTRKKRSKTNFDSKEVKREISPSALSFGLLKIIFDESDSAYSTRLAGMCDKKSSQKVRHRMKKVSSTDALVNEISRANEPKSPSESFSQRSGRTSPRLEMILQKSSQPDEAKKLHSILQKDDEEIPSRKRVQISSDRPKTATCRSASSKTGVYAPTPENFKKNIRPSSSTVSKQISYVPNEMSTYSKTLYEGRPLSAAVAQHRTSNNANSNDFSCSIREARGAAGRLNDPERVFGLKPEELFKSDQPQPKIINSKSLAHRKSRTSKIQEQIGQLVELYTIHQSENYRNCAVPPPPGTNNVLPTAETNLDLNQINRNRKVSLVKNLSTTRTTRGSAVVLLNSTRRNSAIQRPTTKTSHT